jgi:hypothetical protein
LDLKMGILNKLKEMFLQPSIDDADYYAHIAREIDAGQMRDGLWAKALAESDYDDGKARGLYMRMAVAALKQEQARNQKDIKDTMQQQGRNKNEKSLIDVRRDEERDLIRKSLIEYHAAALRDRQSK